MSKLLIGLYIGEIFCIIFIVSPILFKLSQKNDAGRLYGQILWRFYKIAIIELLLTFLFNKDLYTLILMVGLFVNIYLSYYMKSLKHSMGNIDNIGYQNPTRVKFRTLSKISSAIMIINMILAMLYVIR